jgi:hypothetical protein
MDLVALCKKNGVMFAPHDNYVDAYPDSEGFSYANMAFNADRSLQAAFFNRGLGAQSYHPNSDAVLPVVRRNMKLTKDGFAPDACFIDVLSSEPLYDYYGADGRFFDRLHTRDVWRQGFAYIRDYLGGEPQISEAGADQYIGWLDAGARAHMRAEGGPERSNVWHIETSDWVLRDLMGGLALRRCKTSLLTGRICTGSYPVGQRGPGAGEPRRGRLERCAARASPIRFLRARSGKRGRAGSCDRATRRSHRGVVESPRRVVRQRASCGS